MLVEDFSAFINTADFAQIVQINSVNTAAIFDNQSAIGAAGDYGIQTSAPGLTLATSDVPANPVGLFVVVASVNYVIAAHAPDGTGVSVLVLEKA